MSLGYSVLFGFLLKLINATNHLKRFILQKMRIAENLSRKIILVFLLTFLISTISVSQQKDSSNLQDYSLYELLNLEVLTPSKTSLRQIETPASVNVLTALEISDLNFNTLEEVLEYIAGLSSVTAEGNVFTTTTIRGNTLTNYNNNTLLLFNGTPIYNPYHGSFNLYTIPLSSIDKIEIVKGSNSVLYGTNAINAVINIIPKQASDQEPNKSQMSIKYGSFFTNKISLSKLYKKDDLTMSIFGDGYFTAGQALTYFDERNGSTFQMKKKIRTLNIASVASYKNLNMQFQFYNSHQNNIDENSQPPVFFPDGSDTFTLFWPQQSEEYQLVTSVGYERVINPNISLTARSSYQNWQLAKEEWTGQKQYSSNGAYNELEFDIDPTENWNNKVGISYNHYLGWRDRFRIKNNVTQEYVDVEPNKIATDDYAFYLNGNFKPVGRLNFYYGGRYYVSNYDNNINENFSPRLALVYNLKENIYVKALYGNSFRVPSYFEKASVIPSIMGNKSLDPESSTSYELILAGTGKALNWDVNIFYTIIENKIARLVATAEDSIALGLPFIPKQIFKNTGEYNFVGLEANLKYVVNNKLYGFVNYSYVDVTNKHNNPDIIGDDPWFYNHMVALGINYRLMKSLSLHTSVKSLSEWGFGKVGGVDYTASESSLVANIRLNYYLVKDNDNVKIQFLVDNIFNEDIYRPEIAARKIDTAPQQPYNIGRKFYAGISFDF